MSMRTTDFNSAGSSRYYTVAKLGEKRSLTPEGYLLCLDVPVARTGEMLYAEGEIAGEDGESITGGPDKLIRVSRGPEDLFRPETIASFEGKPVTLGHPDEFVTPDNIKQYRVGTMSNVRRGEGIEDDLMFADLLITDREAIDAIQKDGIEEVSNGYEADYEQQQPGRAAQRNILGNHVALVERGRCGPRCAIGDEDMASKKKLSFADRIRAAFKSKDADEVEKIAEEAESMDEESEEDDKEKKDKKTEDGLKKVLDALEDIGKRMDKLEAKDEDGDDEDDDEDGDETMDTVIGAETAGKLSDAGVKLYTGDSAKNIPALAEILAPGTKIPTFDAKTTDAQRALWLCKCQRRALDAAYQTDAGRDAITPFLGGHKADFGKLPLAVLNAAFIGAANVMRAKNNDGNHRASLSTKDFGRQTSVSDINARNREFYSKR
ncbi:DUF2213 domain-containing protein [Dyella japonica]